VSAELLILHSYYWKKNEKKIRFPSSNWGQKNGEMTRFLWGLVFWQVLKVDFTAIIIHGGVGS
jgi:hypothetical protein